MSHWFDNEIPTAPTVQPLVTYPSTPYQEPLTITPGQVTIGRYTFYPSRFWCTTCMMWDTHFHDHLSPRCNCHCHCHCRCHCCGCK